MVHGAFFEIPVRDLERAVAFYEALFGIAMEREEIDGNQYAHFPAVDGAGIPGSLAYGDSYAPSRDGTRLYLAVPSIEETLERVTVLGGKVLYPKTDTGGYGFVAEFSDSEGNCVALHERA